MADPTPRKIYRWLWPVVIAALAILTVVWWLSPTGVDESEPAYETDVTDESGGELIVTDPDAPAVEDVELPETPMTPVPAEEPGATPAPAE
jgi:hypothetical protein